MQKPIDPTHRRALLFLGACITGATLSPLAATSPPRLKILSPTAESVVLGETWIEIEVRPGDRPVQKVEIRVDGELIASLVQPPYRVRWDAGSRIRSHRFQAVAIDAGGTRVVAEVNSRWVPAGDVVDVILITLYASVVDARGKLVEGLKKEDFRILEDGIQQEIQEFSPDAGDLHVALLVDTSRSMRGERIRSARKAANAFLEAMSPKDEGMILSFNEDFQVVRNWTSSRDSLSKGLQVLETQGGTALYDALFSAANQLRDVQGRKGMILLSDGRDESYDGMSPGSLHTFEEALEKVQRAEVTLYTIGLGLHLDQERDFSGRWSLADLLRKAALRTGGRSYISARTGQLKKVYQQVSKDLRHQYMLSYYSSQTQRDGAWRKIRLEVRNSTLRVRTRSGYFAPAG